MSVPGSINHGARLDRRRSSQVGSNLHGAEWLISPQSKARAASRPKWRTRRSRPLLSTVHPARRLPPCPSSIATRCGPTSARPSLPPSPTSILATSPLTSWAARSLATACSGSCFGRTPWPCSSSISPPSWASSPASPCPRTAANISPGPPPSASGSPPKSPPSPPISPNSSAQPSASTCSSAPCSTPAASLPRSPCLRLRSSPRSWSSPFSRSTSPASAGWSAALWASSPSSASPTPSRSSSSIPIGSSPPSPPCCPPSTAPPRRTSTTASTPPSPCWAPLSCRTSSISTPRWCSHASKSSPVPPSRPARRYRTSKFASSRRCCRAAPSSAASCTTNSSTSSSP